MGIALGGFKTTLTVWHNPIGGLQVVPLFIGNKVLLIEHTDHVPHVYKLPQIDRTVPRLSPCDTHSQTDIFALPLIALPRTALPQPIIDIYQVLIIVLVGYLLTALSNLILWFRLQTLCPCQE